MDILDIISAMWFVHPYLFPFSEPAVLRVGRNSPILCWFIRLNSFNWINLIHGKATLYVVIFFVIMLIAYMRYIRDQSLWLHRKLLKRIKIDKFHLNTIKYYIKSRFISVHSGSIFDARSCMRMSRMKVGETAGRFFRFCKQEDSMSLTSSSITNQLPFSYETRKQLLQAAP